MCIDGVIAKKETDRQTDRYGKNREGLLGVTYRVRLRCIFSIFAIEGERET